MNNKPCQNEISQEYACQRELVHYARTRALNWSKNWETCQLELVRRYVASIFPGLGTSDDSYDKTISIP